MVERAVGGLEGDAALPRRNGELVFEAPWQSRAFGMAVALHEGGAFTWDRFRERLVSEIASAPEGAGYYQSWLSALERLVAEESILDPAEVERRRAEFASLRRDEVF